MSPNGRQEVVQKVSPHVVVIASWPSEALVKALKFGSNADAGEMVEKVPGGKNDAGAEGNDCCLWLESDRDGTDWSKIVDCENGLLLFASNTEFNDVMDNSDWRISSMFGSPEEADGGFCGEKLAALGSEGREGTFCC